MWDGDPDDAGIVTGVNKQESLIYIKWDDGTKGWMNSLEDEIRPFTPKGAA
jgi:hypothetical protein